jgi:hypothetical protein
MDPIDPRIIPTDPIKSRVLGALCFGSWWVFVLPEAPGPGHHVLTCLQLGLYPEGTPAEADLEAVPMPAGAPMAHIVLARKRRLSPKDLASLLAIDYEPIHPTTLAPLSVIPLSTDPVTNETMVQWLRAWLATALPEGPQSIAALVTDDPDDAARIVRARVIAGDFVAVAMRGRCKLPGRLSRARRESHFEARDAHSAREDDIQRETS